MQARGVATYGRPCYSDHAQAAGIGSTKSTIANLNDWRNTMTSMTRVATDFHFRTKQGYKRPTLSVEYDAPDTNGIIDLLQSEDQRVIGMIVDSVQNIVQNHIRSYVDNDLEFDQERLEKLVEEGKVSVSHIAHIPRADRSVLSKDDLEQFAQDYIAVMPEITGKDITRVQAAATLFVERFKRAAGDNQVLEVLKEQLGVFVEGAPDDVVDSNERVIIWANNKLDELLSIKVTADAL